VGFLAGTPPASATPASLPIEAIAVAPTLAGLHIYASVVDVDSDRTANHRTLAVRAGPRMASAVALGLSLMSAATIPLLNYAPPIAVFLVFQPSAITTSMIMTHAFQTRWFRPKLALTVIAVAGGITLVFLAFVYLRDW
ncbi:MAG: hypothetical protein FWD57_13020, partial [Polyangiaceae bacterium]|nr:hypothetical protein [Polyangiaceae bacterium]